VVLDGFFVHRGRTVEGKDGNLLNELRMICTSLLQNHGVMSTDKTIKYSPEKSVVELKIGDQIKLTEPDFTLLFRAFFAEIESKSRKDNFDQINNRSLLLAALSRCKDRQFR
jgi:hypothetical protein